MSESIGSEDTWSVVDEEYSDVDENGDLKGLIDNSFEIVDKECKPQEIEDNESNYFPKLCDVKDTPPPIKKAVKKQNRKGTKQIKTNQPKKKLKPEKLEQHESIVIHDCSNDKILEQ